MPRLPLLVAVEPLQRERDVLAIMQCVALDADVFPYPSADFTSRSRRDRVWVAREPGGPRPARVVGFLAARIGDDLVRVQGLAVDPAARQRGIGRALLRGCLRSEMTAGARAVELSVSVVNRPALALYASEGFDVVARVRDHYPARAYGGQRDAFYMRLTL
jgi:ribosomal-protein-alanine N-acetyltransferase